MTKKLAAWRLLALAAVVLLGTGFMSSSANAQTATTTFQVTANVPPLCIISASGDMAFGVYDPFAVPPNDLGTTDITVTCTPGTSYVVGLDDGVNGVRLMDNAGDTLAYEIYLDLGRTTRWDDAGPGTNSDPSFAAPPDVYTAYGRMPAGQIVTATGIYTDTITATVSF